MKQSNLRMYTYKELLRFMDTVKGTQKVGDFDLKEYFAITSSWSEAHTLY